MNVPGRGEPVLRRAGRDEDEAVRAVLAQAFADNPKVRVEMTAWQYWDNPFGEPRTWVYEENGALVAVYTGIPAPIRAQGRPSLAALGIDAAVAPSHQGRRLFTPLSRALYEDLGRDGMLYTLAYPSTASHKGITRAGWIQVAQLRVNVAPLDDAWLAQRFHLPRPVAGLARRAALPPRPGRGGGAQVAEVPAGIDDLWRDEVAPTVPNGIVRDGAWWRWRYAANPDRPYRYYEVRRAGRLRGAAVTTVREAFGGRFAYVLEFLTADPSAARDLAGAIADGEQDTDGAAMITLAGSTMDRLSRRAGFRRLPRRLEPRPQYFGAVPNVEEAPDPSALSWSVAWGDLDHL